MLEIVKMMTMKKTERWEFGVKLLMVLKEGERC